MRLLNQDAEKRKGYEELRLSDSLYMGQQSLL